MTPSFREARRLLFCLGASFAVIDARVRAEGALSKDRSESPAPRKMTLARRRTAKNPNAVLASTNRDLT
jgi:hypothetical protein